MHHRRLRHLLPFLSLLGCADPGGGDSGEAVPATTAAGFSSVSIVASAQVPTVQHVSFDSDVVGAGHVRVSREGEVALDTPAGTEGSSHNAVLLGLKVGRTYTWQPVVTVDGIETVGGARTLELDPPPGDLALVTVTESDPARHSGGFILTSFIWKGGGWAVILDRDGEAVWFADAPGRSIPSARLSLDGDDVLFNYHDKDQSEDIGAIEAIALDGQTRVYTRTPLQHHDFAELPDGRLSYLMVGFEDREIDGVEVSLAGDRIAVVEPGSKSETEPTPAFDFFDAISEVPTCGHFDADAYGTGSKDWTHANSLMVDDEAWTVMSKNLDAVWRVDRQTGEVLWQLGGAQSDLSFVGDGLRFSHAHMSHVWDGGMMVFDNGYHNQDEPLSRMVEYSWDESAMTWQEEFSHPHPDGGFVELLGDARKLPSGNYLVSWTSMGVIEELTAEGEVVWRAESALGSGMARVSWIPDLYSPL